MAIQRGTEKFMKMDLVENGEGRSRRIHCLMVQGDDGKLRYYEGPTLPDEMVFFTGELYKGRHIGECFPGHPQLPNPWSPAKADFWPTLRDVVHVFIGIACVGPLNFITSVAHAALSGM